MAKKAEKKKKPENKFYFVSDWRGYDNYECKHCAFATLERGEMTKHIEGHIRGTPELAGLEVPMVVLPDVDEDHGLTSSDQSAKYDPPEVRKETYEGPKKGKSYPR